MQPNLYHAHHQLYKEDLPFWQELADEQAGSVLELGCGTGRVMLALQRAGVPVYGLDLAHNMLAILKDEGEDANVFQANLLHFHLEMKFNLIFLACNTWSTFPSNEREAALKAIYRHLSPGGIFAASIPNPHNLLELEECQEPEDEATFAHPQTGNPVQVSSEWQIQEISPALRQVTFFWHYDHLTPDGMANRTTHHTRHWAEPALNYVNEFKQQGLQTSTWGDYDRARYKTISSPYLIITGQKI